MKNLTGSVEAILDTQIPGFHQYILNGPAHLTYVSSSFCEMLGYGQDELINEYADMYAPLVHPEDQKKYGDFLEQLRQPQTATVQYRIIPEDGVIRFVNDTATSILMEDGTIVASSVLTDITELMAGSEEMQMVSEAVPYGFLRYTCDKHPKVTYVNDQMLKILRIPERDDELDYLEMYKENVYMMIPMEQRRKFSIFLKRVASGSKPVSGELVVQRCDGTRARLHGWVTKRVNAQGEEEFQTVCMDITENYQNQKEQETGKYLKALKNVYDKIFEYDFSTMTVKCLHAESTSSFSRAINIPMHMEEATEHYLKGHVIEDDRASMREFFKQLYQAEFRESDDIPPQIQFRGISTAGTEKMYSAVFIKMDHSLGLLCCRTARESELLKNENQSLRDMNENMQELMMRFTEGVVAFRVENDRVKPMYASENICRFFGYTAEEWAAMAEAGDTIRSFTSRSGVEYEEFRRLLETGEAEFEYYDISTQQTRMIRAVCSDMFAGDNGSKYVMLYKELSGEAEQQAVAAPDIRIRTFGYFDVFVGDSPIAFRNKKSKELFALLVDRRGGFVSSEEAISYLWEDEPVNAVTLARYRKVAMRLKNILEEYGISEVVEAVDGKRRLVTEKVQCDLFDYLSQKEEFSHLFKGSYLTNYSWGEITLGELFNEI